MTVFIAGCAAYMGLPLCAAIHAGAATSRSLMAEPMTLDTLKLGSTVGLGGWLATLQRQTPEVTDSSAVALVQG